MFENKEIYLILLWGGEPPIIMQTKINFIFLQI